MKIKLRFLLILLFLPCAVLAQTSAEENTANNQSDSLFSYTLGMRLKTSELADGQNTLRLRPVIGLRYGKWQIGIGDGQSWSKAGTYGAEPTLSYQLVDDPRVSVGLSMRAHNVSTGESFDVFEGGKTTLRTRLMAHRKFAENWRLSVDWTQDILNKGDGTTLNFGISYSWPLFQQSELIFNLGSTWATAEHWRHSISPALPIKNHEFVSGFEKINAGLTFKQSLTKNWAWFSTLGVSQPIANLRTIQGYREIVSGQVGILYFKR
jgi:hypothetical protein